MTPPRRVAVATYRGLPQLDSEGPALLEALQQAGLQVDLMVWDAPDVDWTTYSLVLIRSTWDYTRRREQFLEWAAGCRRTANPHAVLAWSSEKHYLADLAALGVPVVPTVFCEPGEEFTVPAAWRDAEIVIKPTVSAGAADTGRYRCGDGAGTDLVARLHQQHRSVMAQPYLPGVDQEGETALVYLGGQFSHAVRKEALLVGPGERPPLFGDEALATISRTTVTPDQVAVADVALAAVPGGPAALSYARVDLIPRSDGRPVVLELELVEPSLFLQLAPARALHRLGEHVAACARAAE